MSAAGKVCIGFSLPYVAKYSENGGSPKYTGGMRLARGVSVKINPDSRNDNTFYADNSAAESSGGVFSGGSVDLVVDGLHQAAERFIFGLGEPETISYGSSKTVTALKYGDNSDVPYLGVGFVVKYQSARQITYVPVILTKVMMQSMSTEAQTSEDDINWQTQTLTGSLFRDDSSTHVWKIVVSDQDTEADAEEILKSLLAVGEVAS